MAATSTITLGAVLVAAALLLLGCAACRPRRRPRGGAGVAAPDTFVGSLVHALNAPSTTQWLNLGSL